MFRHDDLGAGIPDGLVAALARPAVIIAESAEIAVFRHINRLAFALPGQAAICVRDGGKVTLAENARVTGGSTGAGLYFLSGTGSPTLEAGSELGGAQSVAPSNFYDDSFEYVFGATAASAHRP